LSDPSFRCKSGNCESPLKGHSGDTLRVDRVNRPSEYVAHPALTLGLALQPDVLVGVFGRPGFRGRGLLGRFLYGWPLSLLGRRAIDPPPVPDAIRAAYHANMLKLLARYMPAASETSTPDDYAPDVLTYTSDAAHRFRQFAAAVEPRLAPTGDLGAMTDWAGKIVGAVARLAAHLHIGEHIDDADLTKSPLSVDVMDRACEVGEYYVAHALAAYGLMGGNPMVETARVVFDWMRAHHTAGGCSIRTIWQGLRRRFDHVHDLNAPIGVLVERNMVRERIEEQRRGPGRKSSPVYDINPVLLAPGRERTQNTQNPRGEGNFEDNVDYVYREFTPGVSPTAPGPASKRYTRNPHNPQNKGKRTSSKVNRPPTAEPKTSGGVSGTQNPQNSEVPVDPALNTPPSSPRRTPRRRVVL
jgi:hypothetical protein